MWTKFHPCEGRCKPPNKPVREAGSKSMRSPVRGEPQNTWSKAVSKPVRKADAGRCCSARSRRPKNSCVRADQTPTTADDLGITVIVQLEQPIDAAELEEPDHQQRCQKWRRSVVSRTLSAVATDSVSQVNASVKMEATWGRKLPPTCRGVHRRPGAVAVAPFRSP